MKRLIAFLLVSAFLGLVPIGGSLSAQNPDLSPVSKQDLANTKFDELTESMQRVRALLAKNDPEDPDGALIDAGMLFVQERKIRDGMELAKQMLAEGEWDDALDKMKTVREDLKRLLDLLQNRSALSRWDPEHQAAYEAFIADE